MEVLKLVTDYYTLSVQTSNPQKSWKRFKSRLLEKAYTYSDYISSNHGTLWLSNLDSEIVRLEDIGAGQIWEHKQPVFFETNVYNFAIQFKDIVGQPSVLHPNKKIADLFSYFELRSGGILTGSIDFLNEPGKFTLNFTFDTSTQRNRTDQITFDVVSPKLDTKDDYKSIVETINKEYNELVFKYLTLTFHQFGKKGKTSNELIWLSIFQEIIEGYLQACIYVVNRPHFSMIPEVYFQKPDRIKHWFPRLEEHFKEKETECNEDVASRYFRNELINTTIDTKENRFVKYTIHHLRIKLQNVINKLEINYIDTLSDVYKAKLNSYEQRLDKLIHHSMFRTVGKFEGFRQESIVMQKRTGYAQVYRYWLMLQCGLSLFDGTTNIGMRHIWELYELWCFLKMKEMIGSFENIELRTESNDTMLKPFSEEKVEHSILFQNTLNGDKIELLYQHVYDRDNKITHTATTEQRPDIVLNVLKAGSELEMTYLYDAKYRVWDDNRENVSDIVDEPVPDAINQMHRYRDAIYYGKNRSHSAKEVIGAYVLFPGRGDDKNILRQYYQESINTVNIGAFPLLPNMDNEKEGHLLKDHLKRVIFDENEYKQLENAIPQKGLVYESVQKANVFVGVVKSDNKEYQSFIDGNADLYYTGRNFPSTFNMLSFKFFAPYFDGSIRGYYEIVGIRSALKSEIENFGENVDDGVRFFFELSKYKTLSGEPITLHLINDTYKAILFKDLYV